MRKLQYCVPYNKDFEKGGRVFVSIRVLETDDNTVGWHCEESAKGPRSGFKVAVQDATQSCRATRLQPVGPALS